jgi:ribonuclease Z
LYALDVSKEDGDVVDELVGQLREGGGVKKSALVKCKVGQLRMVCDALGLSDTGTKPVLVDRILSDTKSASVAPSPSSSSSSSSASPLERTMTKNNNNTSSNGYTASSSAPSINGVSSSLANETFHVTWLGTSSGAPTSRRNVSSMALSLNSDTVVLVDCGEGTRNQLRSAQIDPAIISHMFITHLHGDHCFGISGGLSTIMNARKGTPREKEPVYIYGPPELHRLVVASCKAAQMQLTMPVIVTGWVLDPQKQQAPTAVPGLPLLQLALQGPDQHQALDLRQAREWQKAYDAGSDQVVQRGMTWSTQLDNKLRVTAAQLQHRMPCWGYVFEEPPAQGINPRKIVLLGDTCNSEAIAKPAMGCDLLSHEATYKNGMEDKARIATHSTSSQAGSFARRVKAKNLVLTHFSARYDQVDKYKKMWTTAREKGMTVGEMQSSSVATLQEEARATAGNARVYLANDFYTFRLSPKRT